MFTVYNHPVYGVLLPQPEQTKTFCILQRLWQTFLSPLLSNWNLATSSGKSMLLLQSSQGDFSMTILQTSAWQMVNCNLFLVAQRLKHLPTMWETWVRSLGREDPLEKEMTTHSSILAWRIAWTEEPSRLLHRVTKIRTWQRLHFHFSLSWFMKSIYWVGNKKTFKINRKISACIACR